MTRRAWLAIAGFGVLLALAGGWRLVVGGEGLGFPESGVVWELRGVRLAAGVGVGAALAVAGVCLQSLLRNPLASPDLMGLAAGAGFCVTLVAYLGLGAATDTGSVLWSSHGPAALAGSIGALVLVWWLGQRDWLIDPVAMVLVGVVVSVVLGAATVFVQQLMPDRGEGVRRWAMGLLSDELSWLDVGLLGAIVLAGAGVAFAMGPAMDASSLSEDEARSVGVRVGRLRLVMFVVAGGLTAASVVVAGPIGFVGLVCPHAARMVGGPGHRGLVVSAGLAGAALVVASDALVKSFTLGGGRMPIGVVTAAIGGPAFVLLLRRMRRG
ncbi:MAG: iron ABC transporter permease [Planctomycetota bacterium]